MTVIIGYHGIIQTIQYSKTFFTFQKQGTYGQKIRTKRTDMNNRKHKLMVIFLESFSFSSDFSILLMQHGYQTAEIISLKIK